MEFGQNTVCKVSVVLLLREATSIHQKGYSIVSEPPMRIM